MCVEEAVPALQSAKLLPYDAGKGRANHTTPHAPLSNSPHVQIDVVHTLVHFLEWLKKTIKDFNSEKKGGNMPEASSSTARRNPGACRTTPRSSSCRTSRGTSCSQGYRGRGHAAGSGTTSPHQSFALEKCYEIM